MLNVQKSENAAVSESASRSEIQLEEPDEESQLSSSTPSADGTWKTISVLIVFFRLFPAGVEYDL